MPDRKTCAQCQKDFLIIDNERAFLEKHEWPLPVKCPMCRQARRMALRNPRTLFKTTCDTCQKEIIVTFERKEGQTIYCREHYLEFMEASDHLRA